jgi:hypothetical protein
MPMSAWRQEKLLSRRRRLLWLLLMRLPQRLRALLLTPLYINKSRIRQLRPLMEPMLPLLPRLLLLLLPLLLT